MQLTFAPMEGITSCIYRTTHAEFFPGADRYYSPFIAPDALGGFRKNQLRDILPENNRGIDLVPQILANNADAFLACARTICDLGYTEINLNVGCPSGTVVSKHKGAGMLKELSSLDGFLADVFSRCDAAVSVKTRMGMESTEEFGSILAVYEKYPIKELIVHARARSGLYKSVPDIRGFADCAEHCRIKVTYNGNVFTPADAAKVIAAAPETNSFMLGRGAVADPALFRVLRGGEPLSIEELREFLSALVSRFSASGLSDYFILARMKELWYYTIRLFPDSHRQYKAINKAQQLSDYRAAVSALFAGCRFDAERGFGE